jgi:tetratricopeptide (TPR) repeat protein
VVSREETGPETPADNLTEAELPAEAGPEASVDEETEPRVETESPAPAETRTHSEAASPAAAEPEIPAAAAEPEAPANAETEAATESRAASEIPATPEFEAPAGTAHAEEAPETPRRRDGEPELPADIEFSQLDADARRELKSLSKTVAELVGKHLVAAGLLLEEDPERALAHARFARTRASRVAVVREAAGIAAYHAGEWAEALGEFRAVRRMTGSQIHLPVMVDCERALGRPERALELAAEGKDLPPDAAIELKIVAAGARRDLGQVDAAVVALQGPDLDEKRRDPWSARLFYAYADNLEAAGRTDDAIRWFLTAADADLDEETDAAERATSLSAS